MASKIDIDMTETPIAVHPLAIVNMSDQYTRIRCGGSALPADAAVMGLLFGDDQGVVYDSHEMEQTTTVVAQVELHQAVFPQHRVLGWYRVSSTQVEPGPEDVQITQQLQALYAAPEQSFLFAVLAVEEDTEEAKEESQPQKKELPLSFFQLTNDHAFVALETWELQTNPAERIALEHSVRSSEEQRSSLADLQHAYDMIQERLALVEQFLSQEGPKDPEILRQVQSLFLSAPVLTSSSAPRVTSTMMAQLATWTKMADALLSYTDKFKTVQDAPSRDHRTGFI